MTPVRQTIFAPEGSDALPGNCLQAAVASLLDLPLDEVDHFVGDDWRTEGALDWWRCWRDWCERRGLHLSDILEPTAGELYLGGGLSPRDPARRRHHVAIYCDGQLVHDPHPDDTGVVAVLTRWTIRSR